MDIKDSYLHGTVGVVKSIDVDGDKIKYTLADVANTTKTVALPLATTTNNGLAPKVINTNTATVNSSYYVLASTDGSAAPSWYKLPANSFSNDDTKVTQTNTNSYAEYRVLLSGNANDNSETTTSYKSNKLTFNPNTGTLSPISIKAAYSQTSIDSILKPSTIAWYHVSMNGTGSLPVTGNDNGILWLGHHGPESGSTGVGYGYLLGFTNLGIYARKVYNDVFQLNWNQIAYTTTNFPSKQINALTGYTKATAIGSIADTDSLNIALGKLEYKTDFIYNDLFGTDNDDVINKWSEIVGFLDSVKEGTDITDEFVTRKTDLTITGLKYFVNKLGTQFKYNNYGVRLIGSGDCGYLQLGQTDGEGARTHKGKITGISADWLTSLDIWANQATFGGSVTATRLSLTGGTSSQFLKADGSVDSNTYLTSRGYIGTTAVQASSAAQNLTGIGNLTMSGNLTITPGNTDNFITFSYSSGTTYSWRLGYLDTGSGDGNYLVIQSAKAAGTSWNNVIRMGNETLDAAFGGNVYPLVNNTQTLGTSSLKWSNVYATTFTGALSGNATTASSAAKWTTARTLTVGNSAKTVDGSANVTWGLHDILYNSSTYVGATTSWNTLTTPGVYGSSTESTFTGDGNPESSNGGLAPYRYGQVIVSRAGNAGMAQFYIAHNDSLGGDGALAYGIKFRTGWNNTYLSTWNTILDNSNYTSYTVKKDGTGASGTWNISISGNAATATKASDSDKLGGNVETSYLRFRGLIARDYVDLTTYTSGAAAYKNYDNGIYSVEESGSRSLLIHFGNTTGSASALEFWTKYPHNSRIKVRKTIDANRVSGAWKELAWYSDIPTKTSQLTNDSGFLTQHQSLANYVTLNTALDITGLKTFKAASTIEDLIGVALKLGNSGWLSNMQTALDFYNGSSYTVPNARIATLMNGLGSAGGTMVFSTQAKHASASPNTNELTERMRIDDNGLVKISGALTVTGNTTADKFVKSGGTSSQFLKADGSVDSNTYATTTSLGSYVTLNTAQEITGAKTFTNKVYIKLSDATLKIYEVAGSAGSSNGSETMCLQTCFDKQDPLESNYVTLYPQRAVLALQPRGGSVGIGTIAPKQALEVVGNLQLTSKATNRTPKIVFEEYYGSTYDPWTSSIISDYYGKNVCTTDGFTHGLYIKLGRNETFTNLNILDNNSNPIARISKVLGHWFDGTLSTTGDILTTEGLLQSSSNGKTIKIGSLNESFCHYETTAPYHYFNKPVRVNGDLIPNVKLVSTLGMSHLPWEGVFSKVIELKNENDKVTHIYSESQSSTVTDNAQTVILGGNFTHRLVLKDSYAKGCNYATLEGGYTREGSLTLNSFNVDTTNNTASIKAITKISTGDSSFAGPVTIKGYCLSITNTSGNQYILMGNQNGAGTNKPSIIRAANGNTYIGYGDDWSSSTGGIYNSICTFATNGSVTANKFIGSLEGTASTATSLKSITIIPSLTKNLSNASWTDTGYTFASLATGTYAIQVTSGTNLVASGIMSVYKNLSDSIGDEIPLHVYGTTLWRPYLRTYQNKLQISSNDASATSRTVTIKIAQIL